MLRAFIGNASWTSGVFMRSFRSSTRRWAVAGVAVAAAGVGPWLAVGPAQAAGAALSAYVSPSGSSSASGTSCARAGFSSIQAAIEATATGGTVTVCPGTYAESVTVDKRVNLAGKPGAVIDATGQPYGVGVATSWVRVSGLTVENASAADDNPGDGIITAGFGPDGPVAADHVTITGNTTTHNDGGGIDVNSSSYSTVTGNTANDNGLGINLSNDLGSPATHDLISGNTANDNSGGCGIVLADHTGVGVYDNQIIHNTANNNGLGSPSAPDASAGSGIILAGGPGDGVHDNQIIANTFVGNGHGGVAIHAHVPGANYNGNSVIGNRIGTNNVRQDYADPYTTGIYIGAASPLSITIVGNSISQDHYGIFTAGPVTIFSTIANSYRSVTIPVGGTPTYAG